MHGQYNCEAISLIWIYYDERIGKYELLVYLHFKLCLILLILHRGRTKEAS